MVYSVKKLSEIKKIAEEEEWLDKFIEMLEKYFPMIIALMIFSAIVGAFTRK